MLDPNGIRLLQCGGVDCEPKVASEVQRSRSSNDYTKDRPMADMHKYFKGFHDAIALRRDAEKRVLAEKRKKVLEKLSAGIEKQRKAGVPIPPYRVVNQGSYPMGTGIKPLDGDYDLDVALLFELSKDEYPDPLTVKTWVYEVLKGHTKEVRVREPVVTVFYREGGEPAYHLDLAIYADANPDGKSYLARGKPNSQKENKRWEQSDPEAVIELLRSTLPDGNDRGQARRIIRYSKRWKDVGFPSSGGGAPTGIALTACALRWFRVSKTSDPISNETTYDDLNAMLDLVREMLAHFTGVWDSVSQTYQQRLVVTLPLPPENDLFGKLTAGQMTTLRERLEKLRDALVEARDDDDPHTAAKALRRVFGDDFPVPEKADTAKSVGPAIVSSGNSA